jgi:hypothetical protein
VQSFGLCGTQETILSLTNQKIFIFAGYPYGHPLDPYVVLSLTRGGAGGDGFWVSGFIQPVWLVVA